MQEPVEHGDGDGGVGADFAPGADPAVGSEDDRAPQVALADDLEQGVGVPARRRQGPALHRVGPLGVGPVEDGEAQAGVEPALRRHGARRAALLLASRALAVTTAAVVQHPVRGEEGDRTACQSTCRGAESSPLEPSSVSSKASALMSTASSTDRPYPAARLCGHRSHLPASRYVH